MPKNFRRTGVRGVPRVPCVTPLAAGLLAAVALAGCKNYDVKYQPFNPRALQESERTNSTGAPMRPKRALPTTLETEFAIQAEEAGTQPATTQTTQTTQAAPPPATGPAIGAEEPVLRLSLRELVPRA